MKDFTCQAKQEVRNQWHSENVKTKRLDLAFWEDNFGNNMKMEHSSIPSQETTPPRHCPKKDGAQKDNGGVAKAQSRFDKILTRSYKLIFLEAKEAKSLVYKICKNDGIYNL